MPSLNDSYEVIGRILARLILNDNGKGKCFSMLALSRRSTFH